MTGRRGLQYVPKDGRVEDPGRVEACRATTTQAGLGSMLSFAAAAIGEFEPARPVHAVLSLHACDTATDEAIALGVRHGAELIAVAPCCQAELARGWAGLAATADGPLQPIWSTPQLRREAAATITDASQAM